MPHKLAPERVRVILPLETDHSGAAWLVPTSLANSHHIQGPKRSVATFPPFTETISNHSPTSAGIPSDQAEK